jgi:predicted O-methyltransferase YrrM
MMGIFERVHRMMRAKPYAASYRHPDWFSQHIPVWEDMLAPLVGKPRLQFLEVGSFEGRSAVWMLQNVLTDRTSSLVCVDTFGGGYDLASLDLTDLQETFSTNVAPWKKQVRLITGQSGVVLRLLDMVFDFVYVDGSHIAEEAIEDAVLAWRLLRSGGIMAFDDYLWNGPPDPRLCPRTAIDAFLATRRPGSFEVLHKDVQLFMRKVEPKGES